VRRLVHEHGALRQPRILAPDPPGDRVHILNPVRIYPVLQRLLDAVESPGARRNAIVNCDAHVGATQ
jgi:hypothetical protein